ncbi:MAG: hypothetical protein WC503_02835 [Candidatus Shapirobacteria bacterium]
MKIDIPLEVSIDEYVEVEYDEHGSVYLWDVDLEVFCSCGALLACTAKMVKSGISVSVEPCCFCINR